MLVTYDEFGGQWDHVPPPGQGNNNGPHDQWGPGTRIPALVLAPAPEGPERRRPHRVRHDPVLATIEQRYDLAPLGTRDAAMNTLANVFARTARSATTATAMGTAITATTDG